MQERLQQIWSRIRRPPEPGSGAWSFARRPERLRRHTRVEALRNGLVAFPAMLNAIAAAKRSIRFEMYIVRDDSVGRRFRDALAERARAGLDVRVLYDGVGSLGLPDAFLAPLAAAGARVAVFHPVAPWRPGWGWNQRDHKKILVVDDRIGFTGGLNAGVEYEPVEAGGGGWLDWHASVEGPAVYDLAVSFRRTWKRATRELLPKPAVPAPAIGRNALGVQVIDNTRVRTRWEMHRAYLHAIGRARRDISILNAYFIPELNLRRAFLQAVKRGVSVRVVVPSVSDVPAVRHASRHLYRRMIEGGVRIFEWQGRMMHAKVGIIDGIWSTIGSYNLDHRSLMHNLEVGLVCLDERLASVLQTEFENDVAGCREVTVAELEALPRWQRFLDWGWYQLRSWL